jgi:hypothetical protein
VLVLEDHALCHCRCKELLATGLRIGGRVLPVPPVEPIPHIFGPTALVASRCTAHTSRHIKNQVCRHMTPIHPLCNVAIFTVNAYGNFKRRPQAPFNVKKIGML